MPAYKRSRPLVDRDQVIHAQRASPSLEQGKPSNKRARLSRGENEDELETPNREVGAAESGSEGSGEESDLDNASDAPPQTQYEIMRDAGFRHLDHLELDDVRATQKLKHRPGSMGRNMIAESGIIESITCYNFMCHERLHVELGPLINFIVGENGSGKSAVLTALTLCLGGKASDTNRGGSLKSFVKEGCEQGQLVVKIKNAGTDAYQPEIYGESIIIERHFYKFGSSGFKIKNADNKTISTKKQEIDEISEWYSLQMGNPLTVLSQDNARQFLNSTSPALKYKYFVSGVQLEQLDNDYRMSQDTLDKTLLLRDDLADKVAVLKKEMESAVRLSETALQNESLREKRRHYRSQLIWSQVVDQEKALESLDAHIASRVTRIAEAEQECLEATTALQEADERIGQLKLAKQVLQTDCDAVDEKVNAADAVCAAARKEVAELHSEERDAHSKLKSIQKDILTCQNKIKDEEKRLSESTGSARADKDAQLEDAKRKEAMIKQKLNESDQQRPGLQEKIREAQNTLKRQQQLRDVKRSDIMTAEGNLRALDKSSGSIYDGFDRDMTNLVKAIANDGGFETKPVGPIGAHIRLLKPEWSGILEKTFGETLNAFVVRSKEDQSRLSNMMRSRGMKRQPPIFIAYGGHLDTSRQEPSDEFDTILRVLEFDDDIFRTQLIINGQIEKVILIKSREEAERIMVDGGGPPHNVSACLCFHDGKGKRGHGIRLTNRGGNIGTAPVIPSTMRPRMQSDSGRQLAVQKENLHQLELELKELSAEERLGQQALKRLQSEVASHGEAKRKLETDLRHAQADMERISTDLDAFEGIDGRLVGLRTVLKAKNEEKEQTGSQYGNMKLSKVELNGKAEAAKAVLNEARRELEAVKECLDKADMKIQRAESIRRVAVANKNSAYERVDIERAEHRRAQKRRDDKADEVADFTRQALEAAPDRVHIPEGESGESINKKYQKIGEQLKQREKRLGATDEQIHDRATEAKKRYADAVEETDSIDRMIQSLKSAILQRLGLWRRFQRQISARIRIQFNYLLSERGFRGKIDLRHRERKVVIHIEPDETRKSASGRDTKTLSGGEKSFSSICMLLSVWEAIGSPIRCLDEFDVFMDNVNRAISTNMLVDAARRSVSRQYILITPNAIEGRAKLDKDVKIIRLTDPRQRTLV